MPLKPSQRESPPPSSMSPLPPASTVRMPTTTMTTPSTMGMGTATVQTALHDKPMVIVYRLSPMTYRLGRRLVRVDAIGMVNLIAGSKIVPELLQEMFTPDAVAREAISMLTDPDRAARIREHLAAVRARLGGPGASRRAAQAIIRLVRERTAPR